MDPGGVGCGADSPGEPLGTGRGVWATLGRGPIAGMGMSTAVGIWNGPGMPTLGGPSSGAGSSTGPSARTRPPSISTVPSGGTPGGRIASGSLGITSDIAA
jgi:hypothetical protein